MHAHSLEAYYAGTDQFSARQRQILAILRKQPMSDREIMLALRFTDPNSVRPRLTELLKAGIIEECGEQADPITRKTVRVVRLRPDPRRPQREFQFQIA